jgi:hypothetical protein
MLKKSLFCAFAAGPVLGLMIASCAGRDGKDGLPGATGAQGADGEAAGAGPVGPPGPIGKTGAMGSDGVDGGLNVSCLSPCHGFTGIVAQWQTSTHYSAYVSNLGGTEVATWTGATACGNCHAIDAIAQRVAGNVGFVGTVGPSNLPAGKLGYISSLDKTFQESTYAGQATVAQVHCTTCHNVDATNDPHVTGASVYVRGSFPLRVATGKADQMLIERSSAVGVADGTPAGKFNLGNVCISCHRSRQDVTNYITASNTLSSSHWGPHEGPQADVYSGKGGYAYAGKTYGNSSHQAFTNGCVDCHMPPIDTNQGIGNHSFYAQLSACQQQGCHVNTKSFDVIGGQSAMGANLQELRVVLNTAGYLTRSAAAPYVPLSATDLLDPNFSLDQVLPGAKNVPADVAGALYNYLLLARGSANGVHNPVYTRELIFDSYQAIAGTAPTSLPTRP